MRKSICYASLVVILSFQMLFAFAEEPFTVVALPDTQMYNRNPQPNLFGRQVEWIVENRVAERIVFVTQLGDLTDNGGDDSYWVNAIAGIDILKGKVPYSICFGNHEFRRTAFNGDGVSNCKKYGTYKLFQGDAANGGTSPDGFSFYQVFKAGPFSILHLDLSFSPDAETLAWAKGIVRENPGKPVIVSTHDYLHTDGNRSAAGESIWKGLVFDSPSIFMVLCGHFSGEGKLFSSNVKGGKVVQLISDYQNLSHGGEALLRLIKFIPDANLIEVRTYSPSLKSFRTGIDSEFAIDAKFNPADNSISVDGLHGFPPDFEFPRITANPVSQTYSPSAPAVFKVEATGAGPLSYQWLRAGKEIEGATGTSYSTNEKPEAEVENRKPLAFTVKVMNKAGSATSKKATLKLNDSSSK